MNMTVPKAAERAELIPQSETAAVLSIVARAAADPNVDIDKLERLMQMQERAVSRQAQTAFDESMAEMQPHLPSVVERGDAAGRYTFARWEDIQAAIKPVMQAYGFALTFRVDTSNSVHVTGILSHRAGHREETSIVLPPDPSGNKNAVQAVASSVAYGKRYTAAALLNLTSHGEDDDGRFAGVSEQISHITEAQEIQLRELLESAGRDEKKLLAWLKLERLSDLRADWFDKTVARIKGATK